MSSANSGRQHWVTGHGGVRLSVMDYGQPENPAIVLIHGFAQCHLSWERQFDVLSRRYRLIVPDTRGHGMSGKPAATAEAYTCSEPYAGDIDAILTTLGVEPVLLVGWSMGGIWANDYLRVYGPDKVVGLALVGSFSATGKYSPPDGLAKRHADPAVMDKRIMSEDLSQLLAGTEAFLRACFANPPDQADVSRMLAFNMMCPPDVRAAARPREEDFRAGLREMDVPLLVLHGARDRIVPPEYGAQSANAARNVEHVVYQESGHAPFWEEPDRFNSDLIRFADRCLGEAA